MEGNEDEGSLHYFNSLVMIAFLNPHTEPHHLLLKMTSSGHSIEI